MGNRWGHVDKTPSDRAGKTASGRVPADTDPATSAQPGTAALGSLSCEVLLANYTTPVRARLALVVTENRLEPSDTNVDLAGNPWRILFARNIYYIEKTGDGGCAPNAPDVVASVPVGGGATRDVAFCAQNYEVYAMRSP